jgi:hypothetical protein
MDDTVIPYTASFTYDRTGPDNRFTAYAGVIQYGYIGIKLSVRADNNTGPNIATGPDCGTCADFGG